MLNKRYIYFVTPIACKSKNIFVILFYYLYYFYFYFKFIISNHNKWWCFYFFIFPYAFNLIVDLIFCLVKIFKFLIKLKYKRKYIFFNKKKLCLTFYINFIKK